MKKIIGKKRVMINDFGNTKLVKEGFSWTYFFFGFLVPFFRKDFKYGFISLGIEIALYFLEGFLPGVVLIFCTAFYRWSFILGYNKLYINELLKKGYRFEDEDVIVNGIVNE